MESEKKFLTAKDISEFMGISVPTAYKMIHQLNEELKAKGYITISGKVSKTYFEQKVFEKYD